MTAPRTPRRALAALGLALAAPTLSAQTIDPTSCDLVLDPGAVETVDLEVCIPGVEIDEVDVYLLADNTDSMGVVLDSVKAGAVELTSTLLTLPDVDIRIGVGAYGDVPPFDTNPFRHFQDVTDDQTSIIAGIDSWIALDGGDVAEAQFYALHRLAVDDTLGWRPDAKRIVVWFGDSPAHDPICQEIVGIFEAPAAEVNEESVIADLLAAGPDGTTVIAISTPFSTLIPDALNNDPLGPDGILSIDYTNLGCAQDGLAGQAERITAATGGIDTVISSAQDIVDAILDTIESVLTEVTVEAVPFGDITPFVSGVTPSDFVVELPNDETQESCVTFSLEFSGQDCQENQASFSGGIDILVNGQLVATKPVTIEQPACGGALCLLMLGTQDLFQPVPGGGPEDWLVTDPTFTWPVLLGDIPSFEIPQDPIYQGLRLYLQVGMHNPYDFPDDPIKVSNGVVVELGQGWQYTGQAAGMQLYLKQPPLLGGLLEPVFTIDGF